MKLALAAVLLLPSAARGAEVTVYNENLGLVRETRYFQLEKGVNEVLAADVAAQIDPTSVHFKSLAAPEAVSVLEQSFRYDLISQDKLLERYLGREIELERFSGPNGERRETIKGTLLSNAGGGRVLLSGGRILVNPPGNPVLPELPEGLLTKPTLAWKLESSKAGRQPCEISYLTGGMGWRADYVLVTDPKDERADLNAWVTIENNSGAAYKDARLKLVAGGVHRASARRALGRAEAAAVDTFAARAPQFAERSFFEYHLYALQRPATLLQNEVKQLELASAAGVPVRKLYVYDGAQGAEWGGYLQTDPGYGAQSGKKVWVTLELKNSKNEGLGLPLPEGRVRVYKKDSDGALEFAGEDSIEHTPKDELLRVRLGDAFDLVGERKRVNYSSDLNKRWVQESFEIRLRNHKDQEVQVRVVERLYRWTGWKILDASSKWEKKDAQTAEFLLPVPKDGETVLTYTVKYSW